MPVCVCPLFCVCGVAADYDGRTGESKRRPGIYMIYMQYMIYIHVYYIYPSLVGLVMQIGDE